MQSLGKLLFVIVALLSSLSSAAYERVISLAPNITELIYAIGAENALVATVKSSNYPPAALALPHVGDGVTVSAESLLALKPDVIFAWQPTQALLALEQSLAHSGVALHYIYPQSLDDIRSAALQLGDWLNRPTQAKTLSQQWQLRLNALEQKYASSKPKTIFILLNSAPLYTLNDAITNDVLRICGAKNWAQNSTIVAPAVNIEQLLVRPVDAVVSSLTDKNAAPILSLISNAQKQPVANYQIDPDQFYRAGPRLFDATEQLCAQITPQNINR